VLSVAVCGNAARVLANRAIGLGRVVRVAIDGRCCRRVEPDARLSLSLPAAPRPRAGFTNFASPFGRKARRAIQPARLRVRQIIAAGAKGLNEPWQSFFGPSDWSNYTVEADVNATQKRRQQGDGGVVAQRYALTLYGNSQMLHLEPWQPEIKRTVSMPFAWKPDTWYRLKLEVHYNQQLLESFGVLQPAQASG